jgi:iron(III) transport system substrate-binding protein
MRNTIHNWVSALLVGTAVAAFAAPALAQEAFDLDALITAAKAEEPIMVYDTTGKIVEMADAFTAKYGVTATGTKVKDAAQIEMIIREAQANNVQGDVFILHDAPAVLGQLLPQKFLTSWLPPDLAANIDPIYHDPLTILNSANVWTYNTELYDACPITNIWQLTEPEWHGKVAMQDPLGKAAYTDWFNQMAMHGDAALADAYKAEFGKDLDTGGETAAAAFVKALAANGPLLTDADQAASDAIGAPGQKEGFVGLLSSAKYRDNADNGYKLGLCTGMVPWVGWLNPGLGLIATGSNSPNAAKLFIHYVLTEEGIAPQAEDGKMSTNKTIGLPADEPSGIGNVLDQLAPYDSATGLDDWDTRQDWQDLWRLNYAK